MTKFSLIWRTCTKTANLSYLLSEVNAVMYLVLTRFYTDSLTEQIYTVATFEGKIQINFFYEVTSSEFS